MTQENEPPISPDEQSQEAERERPSIDWRKLLGLLIQAVRHFFLILIGDGESPLDDLKGAFGHLDPRRLAGGIMGLAVIGFLLTGVYVVDPGEAGVVRRFGAVVDPRAEPGLHYRLPWPIDQVDIINVNDVRRETVGILSPEEDHEHPEPPTKLQVLSGDTNVIDIEIIVQYQVRDPAAYLLNVEYAPYRLVRDVARQSVTELLSQQPVDAILTTERQSLQTAIRNEMQHRLDTYNSGLAIVGINLQKTFPPDEVADAFTDVNSAREDGARAINEANGYANSIVPESRGQAQQIMANAEAYQSDTLAQAGGDSQAFTNILAEYEDNSQIYGEDVTRYRLYLEMLEQVLPRVQVYVVDNENGGTINLRLFGNPTSAINSNQ